MIDFLLKRIKTLLEIAILIALVIFIIRTFPQLKKMFLESVLFFKNIIRNIKYKIV